MATPRKTPPKPSQALPSASTPPSKPASPVPSAPAEVSPEALDQALADLVPRHPPSPAPSGSLSPNPGPPDETQPEEGSPTPPAEEPLIRLGPDAYSDLTPVHGAFSDDPPEDWVDNHPESDPVQQQLYDPTSEAHLRAYAPIPQSASSGEPQLSAEARASLQQDAAAAQAHLARQRPLTAQSLIPLATREGGGVKSSLPLPPSNADEVRKALAQGVADGTSARYRSRISVGAAYQYDGKLHAAPAWLDRNWAAYEDGPALNIPDVGIVKKGQWVAVQSVLNTDEEVEFSEIKVYDDVVFKSLFMPEKT